LAPQAEDKPGRLPASARVEGVENTFCRNKGVVMKKVLITTRVSEEVMEGLRGIAESDNRPVSQVARVILSDFVSTFQIHQEKIDKSAPTRFDAQWLQFLPSELLSQRGREK